MGGGGSKSKYPAEWLHSERPAVSGVGTNAVIKDFIPLVSAGRIWPAHLGSPVVVSKLKCVVNA